MCPMMGGCRHGKACRGAGALSRWWRFKSSTPVTTSLAKSSWKGCMPRQRLTTGAAGTARVPMDTVNLCCAARSHKRPLQTLSRSQEFDINKTGGRFRWADESGRYGWAAERIMSLSVFGRCPNYCLKTQHCRQTVDGNNNAMPTFQQPTLADWTTAHANCASSQSADCARRKRSRRDAPT